MNTVIKITIRKGAVGVEINGASLSAAKNAQFKKPADPRLKAKALSLPAKPPAIVDVKEEEFAKAKAVGCKPMPKPDFEPAQEATQEDSYEDLVADAEDKPEPEVKAAPSKPEVDEPKGQSTQEDSYEDLVADAEDKPEPEVKAAPSKPEVVEPITDAKVGQKRKRTEDEYPQAKRPKCTAPDQQSMSD